MIIMSQNLLILGLVFLATGIDGQQSSDGCSELDIIYDQRLTAVDRTLQFMCGITAGSIQWWHSTGACGEFVPYNSCTGSACNLPVNDDIERYFYYCCTEDGVSSIQNETQKMCFHMQICTDIPSSLNNRPPIAFFNTPVSVYVYMYGEPPPEPTATAIRLEYANQSVQLDDREMAVRADRVISKIETILLWTYIIEVMDVDDASVTQANLTFSVAYTTRNGCPSARILHNIPVIRSETISGLPTPGTTGVPASTYIAVGTSSTVITVMLIFIGVTSLFLCYRKLRKTVVPLREHIYETIQWSDLPETSEPVPVWRNGENNVVMQLAGEHQEAQTQQSSSKHHEYENDSEYDMIQTSDAQVESVTGTDSTQRSYCRVHRKSGMVKPAENSVPNKLKREMSGAALQVTGVVDMVDTTQHSYCRVHRIPKLTDIHKSNSDSDLSSSSAAQVTLSEATGVVAASTERSYCRVHRIHRATAQIKTNDSQ